jgi:hypothetical protein
MLGIPHETDDQRQHGIVYDVHDFSRWPTIVGEDHSKKLCAAQNKFHRKFSKSCLDGFLFQEDSADFIES